MAGLILSEISESSNLDQILLSIQFGHLHGEIKYIMAKSEHETRLTKRMQGLANCEMQDYDTN